jgi:8-oxo-dGTP diphosphatase
MAKDKYHYPAVTVDVILIAFDAQRLKVLLIQRKNPPFQGHWAFPGGFIELNESLPQSAAREMKEETSVDLTPSDLIQFFTAGDPGRDPRGRTVSVCFLALKRIEEIHPRAADDARHFSWFDLYQPPPLAFDHDMVLQHARDALRIELILHPISTMNNLLNPEFYIEELQHLLERIFDRKIDPQKLPNFINSTVCFIPLNHKRNGKPLYHLSSTSPLSSSVPESIPFSFKDLLPLFI